MASQWTFGQKIAGGFFTVVVFTILVSALGVYGLRSVVASKDDVIQTNASAVMDAQRLDAMIERKSAEHRGYLLSRDDVHLRAARESREALIAELDRIRGGADAEELSLLTSIAQAESEHEQAFNNLVKSSTGAERSEELGRRFDEEVVPKKLALASHVATLVTLKSGLLKKAEQASTANASSMITLVIATTFIAAIAAGSLAFFLSRTISRQIGAAIGQVQSSSSELQSAANQQVTGAREQATAMTEISTTISELLATSRQIAQSAQRVSEIAHQAVSGARGGDASVQRANEQVAAIRRQVDLVVGHMLDLGRKSQQIGAILDILAELAEQTNILAINATIEATGAGDAGKRFAVVADEIRKLADRAGRSTKDVRALIEDVRASVNTTVMATETGSKAVDTGTRQFAEVTSAFNQIGSLIATTTEATREIELSTKQQSTAVEQVNVAILNAAQASKETEASSSQTLQTASQLATLSRELLVLVRAQRSA